jgi:hypothetical protein
MKLSEAHGEVIIHGFVVEEILLDHGAAVAETHDEIAKAVMRKELHDVPKYRAPADIHEGLGPIFGFFAQTGA